MNNHLQELRPGIHIKEYNQPVCDKLSIAPLLQEFTLSKDTIYVVMNHTDDIVSTVLDQIDPERSGYLFFASEIELNPVNNCMVPTHRLATRDEVNQLKDRHINMETLPVLPILDPIRRWHNFNKNSVIAIERKPNDVYFRRVI